MSELTANLVDQHDPDAVLRLVTAACARLLGATATGQMLADLAVLGLSQESGPARIHRLTERTLTTVNDLVQLAHAVGLVAGALEIGVEDARNLILDHARRHGSPVRAVARALTDGELDPAVVAEC